MKSEQTTKTFESRDLAILHLAAQYGVVLNTVVSALFFAGKQCGHIVRRLAETGDLELFPRALPGRISYARLTKAGCARIGVSDKLARPLSGHALAQAIAIICCCFLGAHRRFRLGHSDMKNLLGEQCPHPNVTHVLASEEELGHYAVLRVVSAGGSLQEIKKQVLRLLEETQSNPALTDICAPRPSYGHLLLAPSLSKKAALENVLVRSGITEQALLVFELAPGIDELPAFLKQLKGVSK